MLINSKCVFFFKLLCNRKCERSDCGKLKKKKDEREVKIWKKNESENGRKQHGGENIHHYFFLNTYVYLFEQQTMLIYTFSTKTSSAIEVKQEFYLPMAHSSLIQQLGGSTILVQNITMKYYIQCWVFSIHEHISQIKESLTLIRTEH